MTPGKSSLQGKCLSGTISIKVKVENCLLCPSHMTVLFRKMPLTVPQVALSTMGVSKMSTMFTGQGLRLGCAMGEVGGQLGRWSWSTWRSEKDLQLASARLLQPRSSTVALLQVISNGKNPETKHSCWKASRTLWFLPPSPYWAWKAANQAAMSQSSPSPLVMNTLLLHLCK